MPCLDLEEASMVPPGVKNSESPSEIPYVLSPGPWVSWDSLSCLLQVGSHPLKKRVGRRQTYRQTKDGQGHLYLQASPPPPQASTRTSLLG